MKRIIFVAILLFYILNVFSQDSLEVVVHDSRDVKFVSVYEYGKPVTSCECNFENLFRNWTPQFITNWQDIKLISAVLKEVIGNESILDYYIKELVSIETLFRRSISTYSYDDPSNIKREAYLYPTSYKEIYDQTEDDKKEEKLKEINTILDGFRNNVLKNVIHIGDKVYTIELEYNGKKYMHNVVCSSLSNHIIIDNIFNNYTSEENLLLYE